MEPTASSAQAGPDAELGDGVAGAGAGLRNWLAAEIAGLRQRGVTAESDLRLATEAIAEADVIRRHVMYHPERFTPAERDSVSERAQQLAAERAHALAAANGVEEQVRLCEAMLAALDSLQPTDQPPAGVIVDVDTRLASVEVQEAAAAAAHSAASAAAVRAVAAVEAAISGPKEGRREALEEARAAASEEFRLAVDAARAAAEAEFAGHYSALRAELEAARAPVTGAITALQVLQAVESERLRIARDLHDGPAQVLADVALRAEILERMATRSPEGLPAEVAEFKAAVKNAVDDIRRFMFELRPDSLDDLGLVATMKRYSQEFQDRTAITTRFNVLGEDRRLDAALEEGLFRVIQEALINVQHHARARACEITYNRQAAEATLRIKDDGLGFEPPRQDAVGGRLGLVGMRERVEGMGGSFSLKSAPGAGTEILIQIPLTSVPERQ